ncbi:hypothetical protein FPQ18DRAFT_387834 [Pyronema domesticum]|uniref:Uncharacterized protein n=1 Tax=Pyronema omphalodes (strain CBS 100304) TaxID=1076935 RepID=U4KYJ7_PYROM|nr:hypothetical protein FPQ18DRAFT_387834 [Pyronema domesticum]CCX06645.1 Protein of unknown function [Pyronema omphalodes CBS 100304]
MPDVYDIDNLNVLRDLQASHGNSLIVLYVGLAGVAQGTYDVYRDIAQRTNPIGPNHRQIIFAYHNIDLNASIQTAYGGTSIPTVVMFHGDSVVGRLDDLSERVLEKYIRKNAEEEEK